LLNIVHYETYIYECFIIHYGVNGWQLWHACSLRSSNYYFEFSPFVGQGLVQQSKALVPIVPLAL
jgi:hypothetical protein